MTFYSFLIIFTAVFFITYFFYKKKQKEFFAVLRLDSNEYQNGLPITNPYREIIKDPMPKKNPKDWKELKKIFQIFKKAKLMNLKKTFPLATSREMNQDLMKLKQKID